VFWRIVWWALWPLRLFGLGSDAYTLWSHREQIVTVAFALSGSIAATVFAIAQRYPPWAPPLFALLAFAVVLALVGWGVRLKYHLASRNAATDSPTPQAEPTSEPEPQSTQSATQGGSRNVQIQGQTIHFQGTISTGEEEIPSARLPDGRTLVDVTPEYLAGLYNEHTSIQADKLVEAFIGNWIRLSGLLGNVATRSKDEVTVFFESETFGHILVPMVFDVKDSPVVENQLRVLKKGDPITVIGQIWRASAMMVELENCELEKP
jgi:hypothetical protein